MTSASELLILREDKMEKIKMIAYICAQNYYKIKGTSVVAEGIINRSDVKDLIDSGIKVIACNEGSEEDLLFKENPWIGYHMYVPKEIRKCNNQ